MALRGLVALAVVLLGGVLAALALGWHTLSFAVVEACLIAVMLAGDHWLMPILDRRERGNRGEIKVARILASAEQDGWKVLHDVQSGRGNIDHVLVGPGGVLTVETKSHRGRINVARLNETWLAQAYAQRKHVERLTGLKADCLLVFSDAYLVGRAVSNQKGVCVLPARMLVGHLAQRPQRLSHEEVDATYRRLAETFGG